MRDTECAADRALRAAADDFQVDDYFQGQFGIFRGAASRAAWSSNSTPSVAEFVRTRRVHPSQELEHAAGGGPAA